MTIGTHSLIFTAYFPMLSGLIFRSVEFHIFLPVSSHGLLRMNYAFNFFFAPLTYVSVLHWMVGLYYYI